MSTKFEQLLDYLVNEEMDKANELFHEIVVEKSRDIYENLISEEAEEEMDETSEEEDESVDEAAEDDEEMEESMDLEDSYSMEADEEAPHEFGGDATDDELDDVEMHHDGEEDGEEGPEAGEDKAIFDIKTAIQELEAAFAELEAAQGSEEPHDDMGHEFGDDEEHGDEEHGDEDEGMMMGMHEGRRVTREYVEKVGHDFGGNTQKQQGQIAGANSGEKMPNATANKSPISSGKGKPETGATAENILRKGSTSDEDGTSPKGKVGGVLKQGGEFTKGGTHNVNNVKSGVKTLSKISATDKGEGKAAGAGTGQNAVKGATNTKSIVDRKIG